MSVIANLPGEATPRQRNLASEVRSQRRTRSRLTTSSAWQVCGARRGFSLSLSAGRSRSQVKIWRKFRHSAVWQMPQQESRRSGMILSRFELKGILSGASKRGTRNDHLHRQFFPLRPGVQHVRHDRQPRLRLDRDRPVLHPSARRLGHQLTLSRCRAEPEEPRHDPQHDKTLVSDCAYQQHSGNRPCQRDLSLASSLRPSAADCV